MVLIIIIIGIVLIHRAAKKALPKMQAELQAATAVNPAVEKINLKREREWLKKELAKEMRKSHNAKTTFRIKARIEKVETVLFK